MPRERVVYTSLESQVADTLDELSIEYTAQYPSRTGFIIDFALLGYEPKIALEVDGPHHDTPERRKKDGFRTQRLKAEGYKVVRIHHTEMDGDVKEVVKEKLQDCL